MRDDGYYSPGQRVPLAGQLVALSAVLVVVAMTALYLWVMFSNYAPLRYSLNVTVEDSHVDELRQAVTAFLIARGYGAYDDPDPLPTPTNPHPRAMTFLTRGATSKIHIENAHEAANFSIAEYSVRDDTAWRATRDDMKAFLGGLPYCQAVTTTWDSDEPHALARIRRFIGL